jgi:hypothetical protein
VDERGSYAAAATRGLWRTFGQEDVLIAMEATRSIHRTSCSSEASTTSDRTSHSRWVRRALAESSKPARRLMALCVAGEF